MARHDDKIRTLERGLTEAYRTRPDIPVDAVRVTQAVMREIRQATGNNGQWSPSVALDQLVWRTAAITAAVVLVVTVITAGAIRSLPGESAGLLAEEFESAPLFGD